MPENLEAEQQITVSLEPWSNDPNIDAKTHLERQVIEVFLVALGLTENCSKKIFLKGGILIGAVYASGRNTADIDFSTAIEPDKDFPAQLRQELRGCIPFTYVTECGI
ncbi:hypothetical protein [Erythrobacter sp. MTPC3]|uniref:hypothetical protein n=1 Tax=Erythrobacter sp. MTPC3 TaxID=3056564 RepID=UPI0036F331FA